MAKTITMTGYAEYARIFNENMDKNPDFHPNGQFNMNFYPETEADLDTFFGAGVPRSFRGQDRLKIPKNGSGYGIGKFVKLKRDNVNPFLPEWGGKPEVVHWDGDKKGLDWSMTEDGEVGNGSKVRIKLTVYGEGDRVGHRIEKVGIMELVPYLSQKVDAEGF